MGTGNVALVGEVDPNEAWNILSDESNARLVDVRTRAEWSFVGVPDLGALGTDPHFIEWASYPSMSLNADFAKMIEQELGQNVSGPLLFLCRSGVRSLHAAHAVTSHYAGFGVDVTCLNIAEGFEGDVDAMGHRGNHNGWKARGLAWRQS